MKETPKTGPRNAPGRGSLIFLASVAILYGLLLFVDPARTVESLSAGLKILQHILPILLLVILFMGLMKYFIRPKTIRRYVGKGSGLRGWALALSLGIVSHGPIYMWFPLLKDLRDQGMSNGLIAVFLYNRAIKIPLLPAMMALLGFGPVIILTLFMLMASILQGLIMEKLFD